MNERIIAMRVTGLLFWGRHLQMCVSHASLVMQQSVKEKKSHLFHPTFVTLFAFFILLVKVNAICLNN